METVSKDVFLGHCQLTDERFQREQKRLDRLEQGLEKITTLSVQMAEILKQHTAQLSEQKERLTRLEGRPAAWIDRLMSAATGAAVSALVSMILAV